MGSLAEKDGPLQMVRYSCKRVAEEASHVHIDPEALKTVAARHTVHLPKVEWNFDQVHFFDGGPLTAQYIFVVDALNFCFWPEPTLHYEHLARGIKLSLEKNANALDAIKLASYDGPQLRELLQWPKELPLEEERVRVLNEVGAVLLKHFGGQAANLVAAANGKAASLVELVTAHFPGFRDHSIYKGKQVFLYKRAQILAGDLWGAFKGQGLGSFTDIQSITMFADYLVPAVLREWGILRYSEELSRKVDEKIELVPGSEEEVEIRACCIHATEELRSLLADKTGSEVLSVELDWWLWSEGLTFPDMRPHHRTLTVYY